jgi:hypothetical protein
MKKLIILFIKNNKRSLKVLTFIILSFSSNFVYSADVGPDGSFTHQIPIKIPPVTAGMQPNISLV